MEALERALYEIEAKNFFEAENILRSVINDHSIGVDVKLNAYEVLIEAKVNLSEKYESDVSELVSLLKENNKTNQAIEYLKSLYSITGEIFILDLCDDIAFKFGHIGELKEIKLKKM